MIPSRDTDQWIPRFDGFQLGITWMPSCKPAFSVSTGKADVVAECDISRERECTYEGTDGQSHGHQNVLARWVTKRSKKWGSAFVPSAHRSSSSKVSG